MKHFKQDKKLIIILIEFYNVACYRKSKRKKYAVFFFFFFFLFFLLDGKTSVRDHFNRLTSTAAKLIFTDNHNFLGIHLWNFRSVQASWQYSYSAMMVGKRKTVKNLNSKF